MAEAGFFYSGSKADDDSATCFVCGKVLDGWDPKDKPWSEHKKHAPQCAFVKLGKPEAELKVRTYKIQNFKHPVNFFYLRSSRLKSFWICQQLF